ncbi:MAG TPA: septum site-determining protein MinC [Steroidobacteraceae bacterium]|nr:septum site-determining protein MinC [Steroidobacteraceae bacterium]
MSTNLELDLSKSAGMPNPAVIDIRYGQVGLVQVRIRTTDPGVILDELTGRIATAPHFFRRTAVCLDLSALEPEPQPDEVRCAIDAIRRAGMLAIGLTGDGAATAAISAALSLPIITSFRTPSRPVPVVQAAQPELQTAPPASAQTQEPAAAAQDQAEISPPPAAAGPPTASALIHGQTVRSGQRIYARGRDLVITATVGAGAEVMADGCVHIYGSLRGRAMAGARGEPGARVFCQEFHAELVSIGGVFRVFETIPAEFAGKPVQAWLAGDDLHFARIGG